MKIQWGRPPGHRAVLPLKGHYFGLGEFNHDLPDHLAKLPIGQESYRHCDVLRLTIYRYNAI